MIDKLKEINDKFIDIYDNNPRKLKKYQIIKELLNKEDLFLNIDVDYAYSILRDLQIPENELKNIYVKLINKQ